MNEIKKIFSHTIVYALAPQISKIASFFILPIITKDLTDLDYGVFGVITAYTTAIAVFAALGLKVVLINFYFKNPHHYKIAWRQIYGFLNLWNFIYAILLAILIFFIVPDYAIENRLKIIILNVLPLVFFGQTANIGYLFYQIRRKPVPIAVRTAIFGTLTVLLNLLFISYFKLGYMGWFYSIFIVGLLNNLSYWYPLNVVHKIKPIFNFKWRLIRQSLKVSLPTIPHYYSSYLLDSSDRVVLDLMQTSTANIGKYNIAYMFGNLVQQVGMALGMSMSPLMMQYYKNKEDHKARDLVFVTQAIFLIATFVFSMWMKEIFYLLIKNETLNEMYYLAVIIVMSYNYRPMYLGSTNKLFYTEKTKLLWRISFVAGIINVILNIVFIPLWGFEFAAVSTFIAFMYMGYSGYFLKTFKKVNSVNFYPVFWLVLTVVISILAYLSIDLLVTYKLGISLITMFLMLFLWYKYRNILKHGL